VRHITKNYRGWDRKIAMTPDPPLVRAGDLSEGTAHDDPFLT